MWDFLYCPDYWDDLEYICQFPSIDWDRLKGKSILLSGATGQIGSCLVDAIMHKNIAGQLNCSIIGLTRNVKKARSRFHKWGDSDYLRLLPCDICNPDESFFSVRGDFVLHLASNTHPIAYASDPIGTIKTNVYGTDSMLKSAVYGKADCFLLASSNEVYGENKGDVALFDESYCGYINCNSLRAGYPEGKRCAESLLQAYRTKFGLTAVVARLTRTYGPTLLPDDSKAMSQFIKNAINKDDIVLKSAGNQFYSYTYLADAVTGLLTVLTKGVDGEAYNIAEPAYDRKLSEIAHLLAEISGTEVRFEIPGDVESRGFSKVTVSRLANEKITSIGWKAGYSLEKGLQRTVHILRKDETD